MRATFSTGRHEYTITTEHAASSYGIPVIIVDGELTDGRVQYSPDEYEPPTVLSILADAAGVWGGPATRRALADYASARLPANPGGADYDRIIGEFLAEGKRRATAALENA